MNEKLSYEDWRDKFAVKIDGVAIDGLKQFHNIDAVKEVESALRQEYEFYLNGGFDK